MNLVTRQPANEWNHLIFGVNVVALPRKTSFIIRAINSYRVASVDSVFDKTMNASRRRSRAQNVLIEAEGSHDHFPPIACR